MAANDLPTRVCIALTALMRRTSGQIRHDLEQVRRRIIACRALGFTPQQAQALLTLAERLGVITPRKGTCSTESDAP